MNDLDGMIRNVLGLWIDVNRSTKTIQNRHQEWYNPEDDRNAVGEALLLALESLRTTHLHLSEYYHFSQSVTDYVYFPGTESIRVRFRYEEVEQWAHALFRYRLDLEQSRKSLFGKIGRYVTNLRLHSPQGNDGERGARAGAAQQTLQVALFMTWQDHKTEETDPLADARAQLSNLDGPSRIAQGAVMQHLPHPLLFTDQEHPYAPIYDKTAAAIELTERLALQSPPDPDRIPSWRTITTCMRLFPNLFAEGDSERLRNVVWRFAHSIAEFQAQCLHAGEGLLVKEFLEPIDMVIESVKMFSLTGFTGK